MMGKSDQQRFRETYAGLPDDQLKVVALRSDLQPEAEAALKDELEARRVTPADLKAFRRELKTNRAIARYAESVAYVERSRLEARFFLGSVVLIAWAAAVFAPALVTSADELDLLELCMLFGPIAVSGYLGIRARRKGRKLGFYLMTVVPIALLVLSTLAAVLTTLAPR
jgi:hypothetical protein